MASKTKTYGKRATKNLAADFAKLGISSSPTHCNFCTLYLNSEANLTNYVVNEERTPLVEISGNGGPRHSTRQPPGAPPCGRPPGGGSTGGIASALAGTASVVPTSFGDLAPGSKLDNNSVIPSSDLADEKATDSPVLSNAEAEDPVEKSTLPAGPKLRSRRGRKLALTGPAKLTAVDLEYLALLTKIDEVISQVGEMENWYLEWTRNCKVAKIAEGSFGSIVRLQNKTNPTQFTIGKLMPLRSRQGAGSKTKSFTRIQDAASETEMLITMSNYQGFAEFRRAEILHGKLPRQLQAEWKKFDDLQAPDSKRTVKFADTQLWLFLEMSYAGLDLEELLRTRSSTDESLSIRETWDIFWAVALALARGEAEFQFEHRDLQIQNICIKRNCGFLDAQEDENRLGFQRYTNLEVTIIDYTLSRATLDDSRTIFNPMDDEAVFEGRGADSDEALQYDTYRSMRQLVKKSSVAHTKGNKHSTRWETYVPATNVIWLYYLLMTLLRHTAKDKEQEDSAAIEDGEIRSDLETLCPKLGPGYAKRGGYKSAMDLVNPARHTLEGYMSAAKIAEDGNDKEGDDSMWARS